MLISEHHVRECAYYIWENEGRVHGQAAAHWIRAEAELRANTIVAAAPASETIETLKPARATAAKSGAAKPAASKTASAKSAAVKPAAAKPAATKAPPVKAAAKPAAPKPARASKAAVTAGLAAKAKPARTPASMH